MGYGYGGYGYGSEAYGGYGGYGYGCGGYGGGRGFALIVVLFILLIIVGASWFGYGGEEQCGPVGPGPGPHK
ncbi:YjcZ family sporulation protein [Shouchella clausii]